MRISDWSSDVCSSDLALPQPDFDPGGGAFRQQQVDDLAGRAVAEQLPQGLLVPGDAVAVDQGDEVLRRVAAQRRHAEVRVGRQEIGRRGVQVGEVARSEEHTSELQSLMRSSYAVFCLKK